MSKTKLAFLVVVLLSPLAASGKAHLWKRGIVRDTDESSSYAGSLYGKTSSTAMYRSHYEVVVEGEDRIFVTTQSPRWRWSKARVPDVNQEIEYAVDGNTLYLRVPGENKEYKAYISKVIRKVSAGGVPGGKVNRNTLDTKGYFDALGAYVPPPGKAKP